LRVRIERLATRLTPRGNLTENHVRSSQFAQTLPLKRQFSGFPQFGLLAVPFLTFTFMMFVAFKPYPSPAGLRVRVLPTGDTHASDGSIEQVTVSVFLGTDRTPVFLVNSKEIPFDKLKDSVSRELQGRSERVAYVEGDSNVPWADVADVIDTIEGLHCRVILLTAPPARESGCGGPRSSKHSRCRP
jgi:biopolymer transport protein ExbD